MGRTKQKGHPAFLTSAFLSNASSIGVRPALHSREFLMPWRRLLVKSGRPGESRYKVTDLAAEEQAQRDDA
eukprot:1136767-Pelagomonas_calceolata.AAC.4